MPSWIYSMPTVIWAIFFVLFCFGCVYIFLCELVFLSNYWKMLWEVHLGNSQNTKREEWKKIPKRRSFNVCHWNEYCNIFLRFAPTICRGSFVIGLLYVCCRLFFSLLFYAEDVVIDINGMRNATIQRNLVKLLLMQWCQTMKLRKLVKEPIT